MNTIKLGRISIDPVEYGSQGNAVLGIRDSGKTYTATYVAECLYDAGVPFITFDPIGVWRFLRVPGRGKGYPIVVAGGKEGDLPLTVAGAPEIVRAAMHNGVSLVIDLFDIKLSKADWRRIVTACVRVLLHENQAHGLRHVFIEEAAEFIPQKPIDWDVYAEIEKLARMGGNARLGYTLINQRSQEVSKAILELCENIFLHRQRGKNALENLDKWLSIAGRAEQAEIIKSLPDLPQGQCWAWLGGDNPRPPTLVKVPAKDSFHPDRRAVRGEGAAVARPAVNVEKFVKGMKGSLVKVEEEAKANDPKLLRVEIAALKAERDKLAKAAAGKAPAAKPDRDTIEAAEKRGFERAKSEAAKAARKLVEDAVAAIEKDIAPFEAVVKDALHVLRVTVGDRLRGLVRERQALKPVYSPAPIAAPAPRSVPSVPPRTPSYAKSSAPNGVGKVVDGLPPAKQRILDAIAWMESLGIEAVDRSTLAFLADASPNSSAYANNLGGLRSATLIEYHTAGIALTEKGRGKANQPEGTPTHEAIMGKIAAKLMPAQMRIVQAAAAAYPNNVTKEEMAAVVGASITSSAFANNLGRCRTLGLITYPSGGQVRADDRLFPDRRAA